MIKKFFIFIIFFFNIYFIFLVTNTYLSDFNKQKVISNRQGEDKKNLFKEDLIVLKNDTNNVIEFNSGFNINENKKPKRYFWELITKP
jgi:hypothetical protein